ncbi:hypothetical protein SELMODRAFT_405756 [Selaginella moellendorffii]|uniref:Uncharacterized protein n=1 Tax=Selaginella moellendorffii TaxID=88036 RepID=D8QZL8_SELML|nr:hypothetical protein SELMODRAFT_405756 [Selaginella moellendorffii]
MAGRMAVQLTRNVAIPLADSENKHKVEVSLPLFVIKQGTGFPDTDIEDSGSLLPPLLQGGRPVRHSRKLRNWEWKIIWEESAPQVETSPSYFFRGSEVGSQVRKGMVGNFDHLADREKTVFLVNGPSLRPVHKLSKVVVFSLDWDETPYTKRFLKDTRTLVLYMPTWDLCELALLSASRARDIEAMKARYARFGGSARAICDEFDCPDYNSRFEVALDDARNASDLDIVRAHRQDRESSSYLFHFKVLDSTYTTAAVTYASPYVKARLEAERVLMTGIKEDIRFIERMKRIPQEAAMVASTYEHLVHSLVMGGTMAESATASSDTVCLGFGSELSRFLKLKDVKADCPGYYVPVYWPCPCYDSLAVLPGGECWLLRITRNVEQDALFGYVDAAIQRFKAVRFLYVVPEEVFASYPYQKLMWGKQERNWPSVVGIPDTAFWGLLSEQSSKRVRTAC